MREFQFSGGSRAVLPCPVGGFQGTTQNDGGTKATKGNKGTKERKEK
jgi:hypothetical protein